jgi:UDPglucose 6-dehydrogenase
MNIGVIGVGYVGLTAGTCFAESGNDVCCVDNDQAKIDLLNQGKLPIYEPGLGELIQANRQSGRLRFTCNLEEMIQFARIIFIAVGTPTDSNGIPDIQNVEESARTIVRSMPDYRIIVIKSTVPVGTTVRLKKELIQLADGKPFDVVNNPEFLKEGYAVEDFLRPDRVIIGTDNPQSGSVMEELYSPFVRNGKPIIIMDPSSSEMTKYAANALLSTKISFINEMANLCEKLGGNIDSVRHGICSDARIGYQFLYPGLGFGGSCFPKDLMAIRTMAKSVDYPASLINAVIDVNTFQKKSLQRKIKKHYGERLSDKTFAIWGLSFKPRTDDTRESAALELIQDLLSSGAKVRAHDPQAMENTRKIFSDSISYYPNMYDTLDQVDGLCLVTEWNEFRNPNFAEMLHRMKNPVIFDGRNIYDAEKIRSRGFTYYRIGEAE